MFTSTLRFVVLCSVLGLLSLAIVQAQDNKPAEKIDLKVGDVAPVFQLYDDAKKSWSSSDHFGKKWVVIYFYPGDFTPGCTAQAKAFKDTMAKLIEKGVEVVGISGDATKIHELFKKVHKLNFTLLADEDGTVAKQFGVPVGKGATVKARDAINKFLEIDGKPFEFERRSTASRWTFVIGLDGKIAYKNTKVSPARDAMAILEFIEKSNAKK